MKRPRYTKYYKAWFRFLEMILGLVAWFQGKILKRGNMFRLLTGDPIVAVLAEQTIQNSGVYAIREWVKDRRPDCLPSPLFGGRFGSLLPHDDAVTDNELLVEFAGRKCYDSFGSSAGRKSNKEYIAHTQSGDVKHASILYHAKMTFFIAGVSRRMSHELIRNYVGADRDEEGSPSQESTRFTHHYGHFICPPLLLDNDKAIERFSYEMRAAYEAYNEFLDIEIHARTEKPKGLARKRIYEAASMYLPSAAETSFIWTTNPMALAKLFRERGAEEADAEFRRLVNAVWKPLCLKRWPNLFPGMA